MIPGQGARVPLPEGCGQKKIHKNKITPPPPTIKWASLVAQMVKNLPAKRETGSIPGLGRSPGGGHGDPLQYSGLEKSMDRGAWKATVHGVAKNRT